MKYNGSLSKSSVSRDLWKSETISISEAIETTEGSCHYQMRLLGVLILISFGYSFFYFSIDSLFPESQTPNSATYSFDISPQDFASPSSIRSIYSFSVPIGAIFLSFLSDKYGRLRIIKYCTLWYFIFSIFLTISLSGLMAFVCSLFLGIFSHSTILIGFILLIECNGSNLRIFIFTCFGFSWFIGGTFVYVLNFYGVYWRIITLTSVLLLGLGNYCLKFLLESPRWLIVNDQKDKATVCINLISQMNGKGLFQHVLNEDHSKGSNFCSTTIKYKTLTLSILVSSSSLTYYGLCYDTSQQILGKIYFPLIICGIGMVSMMFISIFGNRINRKTLLFSCVGISRIFFIGLLFLYSKNLENWIFTIILIGNLGIISESFILLIIICEIYPNECRNFTLGYFVSIGNIGMIIANYFKQYDWVNSQPVVTFLTLLTFFAVFLLEETKNKQLFDNSGPESIKLKCVEITN